MDKRGIATACLLTIALWGVNVIWMARDSRPPVWDMALHQTYAMNYYPGPAPEAHVPWPWARSGNYPPFVHIVIAFFFWLFHPGPHIAALANVPATLLLFWAVYELARDLAGQRAARWACVLTALTPFLIWMSRETILDYWLSAWVAVALVILRKTRGFQSQGASLLLGCVLALGLLTKWLFAGFLAVPILYVFVQGRGWKDRARLIHLADTLLVAGGIAALWYLPNLPALVRYFAENSRIGTREGEPPVLSFQSLIYYIRLLEGYQLFGVLFVVVICSFFFVWRRKLLRDGAFLHASIAGGWLAMTLLRTKDPRFTMPLLGLLAVVAGAWLGSSDLFGRRTCPRSSESREVPQPSRSWAVACLKWGLLGLLGVQAYAANFGISRLPEQVVLARGYQGSLAWDWNLYLQDYFQILGRPRREDWKQDEILRRLAQNASRGKIPPSLAVIPDLPRFNAANFLLRARTLGIHVRVDHPQDAGNGIHSLDGFNYVLMIEGDQGMSWSTRQSRALNQIVVDEPGIFGLLGIYRLPNGESVRLYGVNPQSAIRNPQS